MRGVSGVVGMLLAVLCAGASVAGCAAVAGSPSPAPVTVPPAVAPVEPTVVVVLPPRPRDVRIDGVDPCSLLTAQQRAELGLDGRPRSSSGLSGLYGGEVPQCSIRGFEPRSIGIGVFLVTSVGIERWTSGDVAAELRPTSVRGFPAVVAVPTRFTDFCSVLVDVAPGQLVDVQFRSSGEEPPVPQERLCRDAEQASGAVLATLLAG